MKATITRVANGYTAEYNGHIYVGINLNDIIKILIQDASNVVYNNINDKEGQFCEITITTDMQKTNVKS